MDLSRCRFEAEGERRVKVSGARFLEDPVYRVKLEGAGLRGYRTLCMAGIRCPTMIEWLDELLENARRKTIEHFAPDPVTPSFRVYGAMGSWRSSNPSHATGARTSWGS